jgi:divalent anion:Na+ symporter, DASS family
LPLMKSVATAPAEPGVIQDRPPLPPLVSAGIIFLLGISIVFLVPRPAEISAPGWRMLAIFLCTVLALMLRPIAGGAAVLIGVVSMALTGVSSVSQALSAYGGSTAWLVLVACLIARPLINSGLARRIALLFVRAIGHTSLGLGYSLAASDMILAGIIPSNAARAGGVILPIGRSLSEIYRSYPGPSAGLLGSFLMLTIYQCDVVACAAFFTGQASNPIGAKLAGQAANVSINYASWLYASFVPALASLIAVPWFIYRLSPPEVRHTPRAAEMARRELAAMGPLNRNEKIVLAVFVLVCGLWATASWHKVETATAALLGVGILLATKSLSWGEAMREHQAWDIFIWYGGLIRMGEALHEFGITAYFARAISTRLSGWEWPALVLIILLIYFYAHYAFASITTHFLSMYAPFLAVMVAAGAPAPLMAYALAFATNLSASLTHYGTTPAPIIFAAGYVSHGQWWKTGLLVSFVNLLVWGGVGLAWWKFIGLW